MNELTERRNTFAKRVKDRAVEHIVKLMDRDGVTLEDLSSYKPKPSLQEELLTRRSIIKKKEAAREALKKARAAKEAQQNV